MITSPPDPTHLSTEYQEVNSNFRMLADIRFKLLALIPTLSGAGVYILTTIGDPARKTPTPTELLLSKLAGVAVAPDTGLSPFDAAKVVLIGGLGFLATLGVVYYDQRNSELYNALISRARFLEREMGFGRNPNAWKSGGSGGQFNERPERGRRLLGLFPLGHDTGLALIYAGALGGWLFPVVFAASSLLGNKDYALPLALLAAAGGFLVAFLELLRMDKSWAYRCADFRERRARRDFRKELRMLEPKWISLDSRKDARARKDRVAWENERLNKKEKEFEDEEQERLKKEQESLEKGKVDG